jgi:hypothetical protein
MGAYLIMVFSAAASAACPLHACSLCCLQCAPQCWHLSVTIPILFNVSHILLHHFGCGGPLAGLLCFSGWWCLLICLASGSIQGCLACQVPSLHSGLHSGTVRMARYASFFCCCCVQPPCADQELLIMALVRQLCPLPSHFFEPNSGACRRKRYCAGAATMLHAWLGARSYNSILAACTVLGPKFDNVFQGCCCLW